MSRIDWAIRDTMSIENDAPRVNVRERGRPSFLVLLNARDPTPGHSYLRLLRRKYRPPSTVRTARAPTDLKPNLIRVKKRDDERAHRREGGERVKEFQHLGTSDRVVGRPRTGCVARVILLRVYAPTAGQRDFDKHLFDSYKHDSSPSGAWPHCPGLPDVFAFSKCPGSAGRFGIQ